MIIPAPRVSPSCRAMSFSQLPFVLAARKRRGEIFTPRAALHAQPMLEPQPTAGVIGPKRDAAQRLGLTSTIVAQLSSPDLSGLIARQLRDDLVAARQL